MNMCDKKLNSGLRELSYSFRISLLQHAYLVTESCEACGTTWKNQKPGLVNCKGKVAMEKRKLNYRKGRKMKQAKQVDTLEPKW